MMRIVKHTILLMAASVGLALSSGCALLTFLPGETVLPERIKAFPVRDIPVREKVSIYWDDYMIPFIEAENDDDLSFALGMVNAHLRLSQIRVLKMIAQGRISEMLGPLTVDIDHSLRILDFGQQSRVIYAGLPKRTQRWLAQFTAGMNYYQSQLKKKPYEFEVLGMELEEWKPEDIITMGRATAVDLHWMTWFRLLMVEDPKQRASLMQLLCKRNLLTKPSFQFPATPRTAALDLLFNLQKSGSNSFVIDDTCSASGAPIMANDPHVGIFLPNFWLIVGIRSPSYHAVGLMIPGIPLLGIGRNEDIAWGGTNMRSLSSTFYRVPKRPDPVVYERETVIKTRWWFDSTRVLRFTATGPLLSDMPFLRQMESEPITLKWLGHSVSDEVTPFLDILRADDWQSFRTSFKPYAVPGMNILYADEHGNIGQLMAVTLAGKKPAVLDAVVQDIDCAKREWQRYYGPLQLPSVYNPESPFLVSCNNLPCNNVPTVVSYIFPPSDRVERIEHWLKGSSDVSIETVKQIQQDVFCQGDLDLRDKIMAKAESLGFRCSAEDDGADLWHAFQAWDGFYRTDSEGAVAFEVLITVLAENLFKSKYDEELMALILSTGDFLRFYLSQELDIYPDDLLKTALADSLEDAESAFEDWRNWGEMHRLQLGHFLQFIPIIGRKHRIGDYPYPGSNQTVFKAAHSMTLGEQITRYGANARHISDLADPDENYFILLGGQDGQFNSKAFADQVPLWLQGEYLRVPLRMTTVRERFPYHIELKPH